MDRTPISSSNLRSVGYDQNQKILEVEFDSGSVYQYYSIPESVYSELMSASSHGKYFSRYIRNNYSYRQIS
ncbi:MAG: KTSC domain-containing protein [Chlorobiales bacterium]|nr:KTSC domain-containing protein [Chlorobiales bacterium]